MKAKGVLMLGVVAARVAPMGAQAETKKVVRLARTVQALRKQVATTEKQLAAARKKALAARRRAVQLTDTLTQVNAALSASQSEVSSLQAELAAIPEPLSEAVSVVQREVVAWSGPQPYSVGEMTALAAVDYTVGHVSAGVYGYQEEQGLTLPDWEPDVILRQGAGICGQSAAVFVGIMQRLGYQVRSVQFYFTNPDGSADTHVAVEVYYDGGWHFFDPTYAAYWSSDTSGNVLPISDIRAGAGTMHKDAMTFTNIVGDADSSVASQNDIWFETDPTTQVVGAISWYPY